MGDDVCPDCGGDLRFEEKFTVTGHDWREYRCVKCGKSVVEDHGTALWQILHDANQESVAAGTQTEPAVSLPQDPKRTSATRPWWQFWNRK